MTTENKTKLVELAPLVDDDDRPLPEAPPVWDGTLTGIKLARPLMRNHAILGPGVPCLDCGSEKHSFHARAARLKDGAWIGPEAQHVLELIGQGVVAGTPEKRTRDIKQTAVELERGVHAPAELDPDGTVVRRPFPELAEQTIEDVQALWRPALEGGPDAVKDREAGERREAQVDVARIGKTLGVAMSEVLRKASEDAAPPEAAQ